MDGDKYFTEQIVNWTIGLGGQLAPYNCSFTAGKYRFDSFCGVETRQLLLNLCPLKKIVAISITVENPISKGIYLLLLIAFSAGNFATVVTHEFRIGHCERATFLALMIKKASNAISVFTSST